MKRISIWAIVLLAVLASAAEARHVYGYGYGFGYNRHRVRWSMYEHGLISGDVYYSPYAHGHGSSGLVAGDVRYSPYAFGHGRSGLVADNGANYCSGVHAVHYTVLAYQPVAHSRDIYPGASHMHGARPCRETAEARKVRRIELAKARRERQALKANDGKEIIAGYLRDRNIDFRTTRTLSIQGKTVSVDFLLNDGHTILKYWNPAEIPSEGQQKQRQRNFFDKYVASWEVACAEHLRAGGKIHQIISSDPDEILAKLTLCPDLNSTEKVYALATEPSCEQTITTR